MKIKELLHIPFDIFFLVRQKFVSIFFCRTEVCKHYIELQNIYGGFERSNIICDSAFSFYLKKTLSSLGDSARRIAPI